MRHNQTRLSIKATVVLIALLLAGCATSSRQFDDWSERFNRLNEQQDYAGALQFIREEIARPARPEEADFYSKRPGLLANRYAAGIKALGQYARFYSLASDADAEAERYLQGGLQQAELQYATNKKTMEQVYRKTRGQLYSHMANYYTSTHRPGKSAEYEKKSFALAEEIDDQYGVIMALNNLAETMKAMGDLSQRDFYRDAAIAKGKAYFNAKDFMQLSGMEWIQAGQLRQWLAVVQNKMDDLSISKKSAEIIALWDEAIQPIFQKKVFEKHTIYKNVAERLSTSGDHQGAWRFFSEGQALAKQGTSRFGELDDICLEARLYINAGQFERIGDLLDKCRALLQSQKIKKNELQYSNKFGEGYEGLGRLEEAAAAYMNSIRLAESERTSFTTTDRTTFFQSPVVKAYWGMIRVRAKQFLQQRDAAHFRALLEATENIRARQFTEMHGGASAPSLDLATIQAGVGQDEALLGYTVMDNALVLTALTRKQYDAWLIPLDSQAFKEEVRAILPLLAASGSDMELLNTRLAKLSRRVLHPAGELLAGKKHLIVMPDGLLNAVPFDLLSLAGQERPLIHDLTIRELPSLKYLLAKQTAPTTRGEASGFFGVGDPAFSKNPRVAGMTVEEMRGITRSSNFLGYFSPLPETQQEVKTIANLFTAAKPDLLLGTQAMESRVKSMDLRGYRFLHFATHGILGNEVPGITDPALVMAEEPAEDGFLTTEETLKLKLNADMTVLSACNTGSGEYVTGEGVLGMSRAFLVAGSRSVVVSLWPVASRETVALMTRFYGYLLQKQLLPAEALRRAKLDLYVGGNVSGMEQEQRGFVRVEPGEKPAGPTASLSPTRHPYYWAPFILIGADSPVGGP
ncbi:MAG: CHAT domain-containing protein [Magnetococcales bacterium]|nr:CHAT domain-containing protein [Magnetococcales bacterium]MBF0154087.1 CHAT domain-containing protein [Magnetococcales bacterium]